MSKAGHGAQGWLGEAGPSVTGWLGPGAKYSVVAGPSGVTAVYLVAWNEVGQKLGAHNWAQCIKVAGST